MPQSDPQPLFDGLSGERGHFSITAPDGWRQGRTLFGGASAALAVEAACRSLADIPSLKSAQFAFIGPAVGQLDILVREIRRGKSSVIVAVDMVAEGTPTLVAHLFFASERESIFAHDRLGRPSVPVPDLCADMKTLIRMPRYSTNLDLRLADGSLPFSGADDPEILAWVRRVEDEPASDAARLVLVADSVPPAATALLLDPCPGNTMNWSIDILNPRPSTAWHLFRSRSDYGHGGYSVQTMNLWDEAGRPLVAGHQSVTLYA